MSRQRLARRLQAVEGRTVTTIDPALLAAWAAEAGCTPEELLAGAEDLAQQFAAAGARTWDERLALVAADLAIPVVELWAELEAMGAMPC